MDSPSDPSLSLKSVLRFAVPSLLSLLPSRLLGAVALMVAEYTSLFDWIEP